MPRLHAILALALIGAYSGPAQDTQGPAPPGARSARWRAFHSPLPVSPPEVKDAAWARTPIDLFIRAELERAGLAPNPPADKRVLFRRASFDLLGLPPEVDEIEAFVADDAPDAWARLVERWLASPRYGERWGRHWMDVAR